MWLRLLVHVEGQTEERFVSQSLRTHLEAFDYEDVSAANRQRAGNATTAVVSFTVGRPCDRALSTTCGKTRFASSRL